jgi:D-alanyl-lipoteichoic acid acyltransferase DltB (MBOAT superfamily)
VTARLFALVQLVLATLVVHVYAIEGPAFLRIFLLATAGFVINIALPLAYRLPFFVLLSLVGCFTIFGAVDGAWLIACGLVLIGICHLPLAARARTALLVAVGALLAASRGGWLPSPWSAAVWPILGSMFMFRLVLYVMAPRSDSPTRQPWWSLAYFFMLPNLVFPLFPVVDYATFRRTYYDRDDAAIYEQGLLWISRGLVHLLLYRLIYQQALIDPVDVLQLGDLVRYMVSTFLLYLRVSGQFHLIVGLLHLFGFRLPETHKLYYLAHSFTELWRRINIYWTEFMMKAVFYPAYFKLKGLGPTRALVLSTSAVFVVTWLLHSYQWFWLRGGFPVTPQDTLFWAILGGLVVAGALRESQAVKKRRTRVSGWSWRLGLQAATTFWIFCFLWSLWSTDSMGAWMWMLSAVSRPDVTGLVGGLLVFGVIFALGGRDWNAPGTAPRPAWLAFASRPGVRATAAFVVLLAAAHPAVLESTPAPLQASLASLKATGLNARDAALQHRGYYEQLDVRAQITSQAIGGAGQRPADWQELAETGMIRERNDMLTRDLEPSRSVVRNGETFSTNRWGMRDRDYSRTKPEGTLRVALLGPSHVMGNGVSDGQTFEALLEERLGREYRDPAGRRIEILNFAVDGFSLSQQVALLEERVLDFAPDIVVATVYHRNRVMTEGHIRKLLARDVAVADAELLALLERAGLAPVERGSLPVPFRGARSLLRSLGVETRMPQAEVDGRVRSIADDVVSWSVRRLEAVTREHGIPTVVLGLNAVIDDTPPEIPAGRDFESAGLPVIDLFDTFPEAQRPALRVAPWDDHPNRAGHQMIADRLYPEFAAFLARTAGAGATSTATP